MEVYLAYSCYLGNTTVHSGVDKARGVKFKALMLLFTIFLASLPSKHGVEYFTTLDYLSRNTGKTTYDLS